MVKINKWALQPFSDPDRKRSTHGDSLLVLDGLRGLAVLLVIASHTSAFGMHGHGSLGVLLFFFLSGFVLTLPYSDDMKQIRCFQQHIRYFLNRALRIVPIYVVAVITIDLMFGGDGFTIKWKWVFDNISFVKGWNHLWSVAEEVRFYVLFPVVMLLLSFVPGKIFKIVAVCICAYFFYRYRNMHKIDMMDGRFVSFYFWVFLGGVLTCLVYKRSLTVAFFDNRYVRNILSVLSVLILLFIFFSSTHMIETFWKPIFPSIPKGLKLNGWRIPHIWFFLFFMLIFTVTRYGQCAPSRFLRLYFLRHIGLLSYSLYLFHMPVLLKMKPVLIKMSEYGVSQEGMFAIIFIITYSIAIMAYILIEKPFLNLKYKLPASSIFKQANPGEAQ